jgi:hypothetical protein
MWGQQNMQNKNYVYVMIFFFAKLEAELGCVWFYAESHRTTTHDTKKDKPKNCIEQSQLVGGDVLRINLLLNLGGVCYGVKYEWVEHD